MLDIEDEKDLVSRPYFPVFLVLKFFICANPKAKHRGPYAKQGHRRGAKTPVLQPYYTTTKMKGCENVACKGKCRKIGGA
jgi:hypothetical protein